MKHFPLHDLTDTLKSISRDRERTNLLRKQEQKTIAFLVERIPSWISSDMLTYVGFFGSIVVFAGFILAAYLSEYYLLLGVAGFIINWFGDSLDGRIAYFRKKPRKWYGFSFDLTTDWLTVILIGWGYIIYADGIWEIAGFGFVVMYGWAILTTLIRYKVTGKYSIDSGVFGPTEVRIIISFVLVAEVFFKGSVLYSSVLVCVILFVVNIIESRRLLKLADETDKKETLLKMNSPES